jgi:hypothetical protein
VSNLRTDEQTVAYGKPIDVSPGDIFPIGALRALLKASCANAGGLRAWGRLHGITAAYISRVIRGEKLPGPKLLDALNLMPSTVYVFKNRVRRGRN